MLSRSNARCARELTLDIISRVRDLLGASATRSVFALLSVAWALLAPGAHRSSPVDSSRSVAAFERRDARPRDDDARPAFRLGDSARPFGWSTVVGDFNTDGTPDVVVADHVDAHADGYEYRIEFSVSGEPADDVTFESTHDAVTISVADVDRDNDLDVIVGTPLSGETVGVWLNDGRGHFTAGDLQRAPATLRSDESFDAGDAFADVAASEPPPRRVHDAIAPAVRSTRPAADGDGRVDRPRTLRTARAFTSTSPRAPPAIGLTAVS